MRPLPCTFVAALCTAPLISLVAQEPRGVLVPVGALVKAESAQSGKTTEGTVLAWRGDTLVMRAAEGGDTVRIAAAALKKLRIAESPTVWRHTSPSDINFFASVAVPRPGDADRSSGDAFRDALLIANKTELAAIDPATGDAIWTRKDLTDLHGVALDFVGATGYGVVTRGEKMEIIDFRTGERRWDTGTLSLLSARGWLSLPGEDTLLLMYGRTAESATTLMTVELATGKVRWRQDHLFGLEPKVFGTGGVSYLFGHQPPSADTDTTFVLYLSADGPIRVHARTGALVWRTDAFREAKVPTLRDGYARIARRQGVLFVPSEKRLLALNVTDGHAAWPAPHTFKSQVIRMDVTRHGLLARGDDWLDLLDPATGQSVWRAPVTLKNSTRIVLRGDTVYVAADNKVLAIQMTDGSVRTVATVSFKEGEAPAPGGFGVWREGIVLNSWHNVMLVDRQGAVRYHHVYPSPKQSFGEALRSGTGSDIMRPTTRWLGDYLFFFTGAPDDGGREGFSVVKVDPATGHEEGRLWFDQRVPAYTLETGSTVFYRRNDREIDALKFADWTALAHAARNGHGAVVERLLGMGVDANATSDDKWTALHVAARAGHREVVRLLLGHGARVDAKTESGWTPWMLAAREGHDDVAQSLREAGAAAGGAVAGLVSGWHLAVQGRITEALTAYAAAQAIDSTLALWPAAWQTACWHGGLTGQAAVVIAMCDKAVERTPADDERYASAHFARGLARALTGNLEGAAADLEPSLDPEEDEGELATWIDALRSGRNPFTPAVIAMLQRR